MSNLDLNRNFYNESYSLFGHNTRTLNWGSKFSQSIRFQTLTKPFPLYGKTILDVGCGFADLHTWLNQQQILHHYTGIDISGKVLSKARSIHPSLSFYELPVTSLPGECLFDYVFASGIFTYSTESPYTFLLDTVQAMSRLSRYGFAFNTLISSFRSPVPGEFHANVTLLMTLLKQSDFGHDFNLSLSYVPGDATFYVYK